MLALVIAATIHEPGYLRALEYFIARKEMNNGKIYLSRQINYDEPNVLHWNDLWHCDTDHEPRIRGQGIHQFEGIAERDGRILYKLKEF
jgi:hypothetical protein